MKKHFTYLFMIIFLVTITGCSNSLTLNENEIMNITYHNTNILKEDYDTILPFFKNIHFSRRKVDSKFTPIITITTKDKLYHFSMSPNYDLTCQDGKKKYYSRNKKTNQKFIQQLKKIQKKYRNKDFYQIKYVTDYKEKKNDTIIKIDHVNEYFQLKFILPITELKIHKVEQQGSTYQDIDLIYQSNKINIQNPIMIRVNPRKDYFHYRITFTNKYGLTTSIIPTYDIEKETGKIKYIINYQNP